MVEKINLLSNPASQKEAVFVAFTTTHTIWENYHETTEEGRQFEVPLVLMVQRWDGCKGFIGGNVDEGETLLTALSRELKEEANFVMSEDEFLSLSPVCSHKTEKNVTHLFTGEISFTRMKQLIANSVKSEHFMSEIVGLLPIPFVNYPHKKSFDTFIKDQFAATVKEEIKELIKMKKWALSV